eukprot:3430006-Heterocapsa_arctica.AAC.1
MPPGWSSARPSRRVTSRERRRPGSTGPVAGSTPPGSPSSLAACSASGGQPGCTLATGSETG